jgi:tRNA threonylcarbamoyl adenosine modification protein YeaZ
LKILAFYTAGEPASVALVTPQNVAARELQRSQVFEQLLPVAQDLLSGMGLSPHQLDGIAIARGPGSFTGLRVGAAAALGLSQATKVPLLAASTLEVWAGLALTRDRADACHVTLDARREELYVASFRSSASIRDVRQRVQQPELADGPYVLSVMEALEYVGRSATGEQAGAVVCGDGRDLLVQAGLDSSRGGFSHPPVPLALALAELVLGDIERHTSSIDGFRLEYHRDPQAVTARRSSGPRENA